MKTRKMLYKLYTREEIWAEFPQTKKLFTENTTYIVVQKDFPFIGADNTAQKIPAGFISDGCSVPRLFWRFIDPTINATTIQPAIKHDYGYRFQYTSKTKIDTAFLSEMIRRGYKKWKAILTWLGVALFGFVAWNKWKRHREERQIK